MREGIAVPRSVQSRGQWRSFPALDDDSTPESARIASRLGTPTAWRKRRPGRIVSPVAEPFLPQGSGRLEEGQRPSRGARRGSCRQAQVREYPDNHRRLFNCGDDPEFAATLQAVFEFDLEHALEQARAWHQCGQALHEFQRQHPDMRGAVAPGALELQHDITRAIALEPLNGDRRARDVAARGPRL